MKKKQNRLLPNLNRLSFLILLFFINFSFCQNRQIFKELLNFDLTSDQIIVKADSLIHGFKANKADSLEYIYYDYSYWLSNIQENEKAISSAELAVKTAQKKTESNINLIQALIVNLAYCYNLNDQHIKSIEAYEDAIHLDNSSYRALLSYIGIADKYYDLKNYHKAYDFYEVTTKVVPPEERNLAILRNAYENLMQLSFFFKSSEDLKKGDRYGRIADSLASITNTSLERSFYIKLNIALMNNEKQNLNYEEAKKFYIEALSIAEQLNDTDKIATVFFRLGDLYNLIDEEESIKYYQKSLEIADIKDIRLVNDLYYGLGQVYSIKEEYEKSLGYRYQALKILTERDFDRFDQIDNEFLINFEYKIRLFKNLQQLALAYLNYYEESKNKDFLNKALLYFNMCDILVDAIQTDNTIFKSRTFWREISTDLYGKAIKICYLLDNKERAFYFMEKNKALLLLEDISSKRFEKFELESHPNKAKILNTKKKIAVLEAVLNDKDQLSKHQLDSLKKKKIDFDIEYSILKRDLNVKKLDTDVLILPLDEITKNLGEDEIVIEYHISVDYDHVIYEGEEKGYVLILTNKKQYLLEINELDELKKDVLDLLELYKSPYKKDEDVHILNEKSYAVFDKIFPTDDIKALIKNKKLTIIPDNYLSLLPFEALSTTRDINTYLIQQAEIHYLYSNSFQQGIKKTPSGRIECSVIAPVNFENQNLVSLINSKEEASSVLNYYSGSVLFGKEATKANFINTVNESSSGIVHIASHANAERESSPWIAFNDEKISLEELYLLENNASLVVLNGCNTSVGKQEIGEGIMSLARGFFYSGSQSVISSLWSIDDRSTAEITDSFYKNLSNGQTKSQALHNAKISFLNSHDSFETAPHFWASLILLGENDVLKPNDTSYWPVYLISIVILILIFFFLRKKYTR